jgi:hypothetical protein
MVRQPHFLRRLGSVVTQSDLRRPAPDRKPRATILVVCEGTRTEPAYFRGLCRKLRLASIEVEVMGGNCGSAPISVVDYAINLRNNREREAVTSITRSRFDEVWCVFDTEEPGSNSSFLKAVQKAKDNKLNLAISNPCFEYWILLHFAEPGKSFHRCAEVVSAIKKHLPNYSKGGDHFDQLHPRTNTAIQRARKQVKITKHLSDEWPNPITHVHRIVEKLQDVARG